MDTISWILFLTVTLYLTLVTIQEHFSNLINKKKEDAFEFTTGILACLCWSIWYMYFLN